MSQICQHMSSTNYRRRVEDGPARKAQRLKKLPRNFDVSFRNKAGKSQVTGKETCQTILTCVLNMAEEADFSDDIKDIELGLMQN
uniref:Uncharacterized protein n=1 Tax=Strigamia maritima TaxID=126957 RepID=T1JMP9_STRMM